MDSDDFSKLRGEIGRRSADDVRIAQILDNLDYLNRRLLDEDLGILPRLLMEIQEIKLLIGSERLITNEGDIENRVLRALEKGKLNFTYLLRMVKVTKPTLSRYLKGLERKGMVSRKKVGRVVEYQLVRDSAGAATKKVNKK